MQCSLLSQCCYLRKVVFICVKDNARFLFLFWALLVLLDIFCHSLSIHHLLWRQRQCHFQSWFAENICFFFSWQQGNGLAQSEVKRQFRINWKKNRINYNPQLHWDIGQQNHIIIYKHFSDDKKMGNATAVGQLGSNKANANAAPIGTIDSSFNFGKTWGVRRRTDEWKLTNEVSGVPPLLWSIYCNYNLPHISPHILPFREWIEFWRRTMIGSCFMFRFMFAKMIK